MNATMRPSANGAILLSLRRPLAQRRKLAATLAAMSLASAGLLARAKTVHWGGSAVAQRRRCHVWTSPADQGLFSALR